MYRRLSRSKNPSISSFYYLNILYFVLELGCIAIQEAIFFIISPPKIKQELQIPPESDCIDSGVIFDLQNWNPMIHTVL